jgi:hypothetical protein
VFVQHSGIRGKHVRSCFQHAHRSAESHQHSRPASIATWCQSYQKLRNASESQHVVPKATLQTARPACSNTVDTWQH